jgi:hypothetical protein
MEALMVPLLSSDERSDGTHKQISNTYAFLHSFQKVILSIYFLLPSLPFPSRPSLAFVVLHIFLSAIYMKMTDCHLGCSAV